jgi:ABC-type multidrug transport system ATPase subunit
MSLGRVFCSAADVYVLDCPFNGLSIEAAARVERMLRKKQEEGVLILLALQKTDNILDGDNVIILSAGITM